MRAGFIANTAAVLAAAGIMGGAFIFSAQAAVPVTWNRVSLSSSGDASWSASYSSAEAVDKYEIHLARMKDGVWNYDYKTYRTSDSSYSISFGSIGKYQYQVRAKFVGGEYSDWSQNSNTVNVTSDDLDTPDANDWNYNYGGPMYNMVDNGNGTITYQTPAGPGANAPLITITTGATGSAVTGYSTGAYGGYNYGGYNGYTGVGYGPGSLPGGTPISTAETGWVKTGTGWTYRYSNGTVPRNTWDRVGDKWYYFNNNGIMQTGWVWHNNNWYYCLPTGEMATGWNNVNEKWYYLDRSGIMQTGYIHVDGKTYYCDVSGARVQSAYNPDGHQFDLNGVMIE